MNIQSSFECLPIVAVVIFGKESVNIRWLESPDICHVQINQLGRDVIVDGVHELHLRKHRISHEAQVHDRRRAYEIVERILPLVGVHGTEFEHARDGYHRNGVALGREGHHVGPAGGDQSAVGLGMSKDEEGARIRK